MEVDDPNDLYFKSYEDLEIHKLMLKDEPRNTAYREAIFNNKADIEGKVVLDVGAGTGILSIFCAQAGAKKVYAVEASSTYRLALDIVRENMVENIVQVIHSRIEDVTTSQIPEKVDVIVSEWMGFYLLHEGMLDTVIIARDRFLKPDGLMFPESAGIYATPCSVPSVYKYWENVNGVHMESFSRLLREQAYKKPLTEKVHPDCLLSQGEVVSWLDLKEVTKEDLNEIKFSHVAVATKESTYEGICIWFTCTFPFQKGPSSVEPVILSTEPDEPETHWKQTLICLPNSLKVEVGSPICYDLVLKRSEENSRRYTLELSMLDPDEVEHPEFCSCYMTKCILANAMLEKYERGQGDGAE
ncbi:protein arginine N-methyltransferase 6 [Anthonomus grandis grandis]|uniref:protein arginine N-methyltransferase 6 n=1 Tax=Anthonomus grandis grandis TaxID=2921223 RepID=UPI002166612A|nr:protein arginine N-methyltransferase 6 [Anthonomus grandis grandis]